MNTFRVVLFAVLSMLLWSSTAISEPMFTWLFVAGVIAVALRRIGRVAGGALLGMMLAGNAAAIEVTGQATVEGLELVSSARVSRTVFEYTYRIRVANTGDDLGRVIATVSSTSPATEVVDMNVDVGDVPGGGVTLSTDTFIIRHDRAVPFNPAVLSWVIDAASVVRSALRLNEVRFAPFAGDPPFVELWNSGTRPISLGTFRLRNELGAIVALPGSVTVAAGGFALVLFDGQSGVNGATIHLSAASFLNATSGVIELLGPAGFTVDRVAWGEQSGSVSAAGGGFSGGTAPGAGFIRTPGVVALGPTSWATVSATEVTPGLANPVPSVQTLLPFSGTIVPGPQVSLYWYPVAGVTSYRVQFASDTAFAVIVSDQQVSFPETSITGMAAGTYYWRVQAIGASGGSSAFSEVNEVTVDAAVSPSAALSALSSGALHTAAVQGPFQAAAISGTLNIPALSQHKDSQLLLLESRNEHGAHGWSVDHGVFDPGDPADNMNCGAASVAMVNRFFGGQLSQDRINYEVFRGRNPAPGPEWDFAYGGTGYNVPAMTNALTFALGGAPRPGQVTSATQDLFWQVVQTEIDAGRPIVLAAVRANNQGHATVLFGYREVNGERRISHADPWAPGSPSAKLEELRFSAFIAGHQQVYFWALPLTQQARSDEPEMTMDSDNDGVVDFDETRRFGTDPFDADTDNDFVGDLADIRASVFDRQFGYSLGGNDSRVDIDGDGAPMELDADSDGDKCTDGQEDFTLNGDYEPALGESHNYFAGDKRCRGWIGTSVYDYRLKKAPFTHIRVTGRLEWISPAPNLPGPPPPVDSAHFVPQGNMTIELFSVEGCKFSVNPSTWIIDNGAGQLDIDYTVSPPRARGHADGGSLVTLTNCQGQSFPEFVGAILFTDTVLNAAEDEIKGKVMISDPKDTMKEITVNMNYHLGPR